MGQIVGKDIAKGNITVLRIPLGRPIGRPIKQTGSTQNRAVKTAIMYPKEDPRRTADPIPFSFLLIKAARAMGNGGADKNRKKQR